MVPVFACAFVACLLGSPGLAVAADAVVPSAPAPEATGRDGSHDFDFNLGVWTTRIRRHLHPLAANADDAANVVELTGTVTVRALWGGRALVEEIEADGPLGHWQGLTLFLYNPRARQWTQSFANSAAGTLSSTLTGSWKDGRIELLSQDVLDGRFILVRGVWSAITPTSHRYQEDYSGDGGRTWAPAFDAQLTRSSPA